MYTVYGKNECPMCFKVKNRLDLLGKEYEYKELDKDFTVEEFEEKVPERSYLYHKWFLMVKL